MLTLAFIVVVAAGFIIGFGAATLMGPKEFGILHINKTGEKDNYMFEIFDLNAIEEKSTIALQIDVKQE